METEPAAQQALKARLDLRARLFSIVREFFAARGVLEVDTPALSAAGNPDPAVEPLTTNPLSLGQRRHFLHTSPELPMKRLLAAGSGDIWQLCRVFRDRELGRWHEPEFMLLEWYRLGFDEHALMREVGELLNACIAPQGASLASMKLTYREALERYAGIAPLPAAPDDTAWLRDRLHARGVESPDGLDVDGYLDLAVGTLVLPALPADRMVFIHDYPPSQAALAALRPTNPPVAARFEVFVGGIELGNGFRELRDAREQRSRFAHDAARREQAGLMPVPIDEPFLAALERGLPDCAGVALGFDRIAAVAAGAVDLAGAVSFAHADARR